MYKFDEKPHTHISTESTETVERIRTSECSVLVGRNNCGKSFLLKTLTQGWGNTATYIGPSRYQNFNLLGFSTPSANRRNEKWNQFINQWQQQNQNIDNSPLNLQQAISELSDDSRNKLTEIIKLLLGVDLEIKHTIFNNSMSQKYISCDGHNISYTSSGFRLITTLITSLLDTDFDTFLIDEPELGISPEAQGILADFLFNREHREKYFPHIKTLVFATHSTIFLDRQNISNNYMVEKEGDKINVRQIKSQAEFNNIHFFLLGNRFETLFLPSAIVLVEGKTDHKFIDRALTAIFPNHTISIIFANSDDRIKEVLNITKGIFSNLQKSPYKDRIFVVLDSVHSRSLPSELEAMGVNPENIIKWSKNGIEYFYPPEILDRVYGCGGNLAIQGDLVTRNGISFSKNELADKVVGFVDKDTKMNHEFVTSLCEKMKRIIQ
jgi:predicted ATP-dependent endonuclease of OLD family